MRPLRQLRRLAIRGLRLSPETFCAAAALSLFLATRLVGLTSYPVAFLGDEAVQVVDAAALVDNGFRDEFGDLLPTYLRNGPYLNLGTSVYLQIVPYWCSGTRCSQPARRPCSWPCSAR